MNQNFSVVFYEIVRYAYKKRQRRSSGKNKVFYTYKGLETEGMAHRKDTRIIRRQKQKPGDCQHRGAQATEPPLLTGTPHALSNYPGNFAETAFAPSFTRKRTRR